MTRPQIIRADTLDLQDKTSPTAQDHSRQPQHPAPLGIGPAAPHQEAALQRVSEERSSEEAHLQQSAYGYANSLRDDPGSDDERTVVNTANGVNGDNGHVRDEQAVRLNGGSMGDGVDDGEMQDADVEEDDMDDDMMDKISSSPSITDGAYELPSPTTGWPQRSSSLTPTSTPVPSPNKSPASHDGSSSPFMTTPIHFPLSVANARRHVDVLAAGSSSSLAFSRPVPSPLRNTQSAEHHHDGEYERVMGNYLSADTKCLPGDEYEDSPTRRTRYLAEIEGRLQNMRKESQWSLSSSSSDGDLVKTALKPVRSPLRESFDSSVDDMRTADEQAPKTPRPVLPPGFDEADDTPAAEGLLLGANGKLLFGTNSRSEHNLRAKAPPPHVLPGFNKSTGECSPIPTKRPTQGPRASTPHPCDSSGADEPEDMESWTTDSDADSWDGDLDGNDDDDSSDISFSDDPRFIDSGWGGECLRELEDIDFEFVYALHTFVATVEGQANATKGDTMVLLDDSNSYWWLVRVVKDSSIGYLPAEHIETPTERLARLNKHRNIDLSATMLGDTIEKTKNPLKKAYRRKNAKTVQFAPPTYVEASEYDYTSDEDNSDELFGGADPTQNQAQAQASTAKAEPEQEDGLKVQPLKLGAKKDTKDEADQDGKDDAKKTSSEKSRSSDEDVERPLDPKVTRNGTLRNTDSFFGADNVETRKITLTPNLLRDDSSTSTTGSRERGPSLESLEKNGFADKAKEDKKKKDKKPGMLRGLFGRKEKKPKGASDSMDSDVEKVSEEVGRSSPQSKASDDTPSERLSTDPQAASSANSSATSSAAPSRQSSKGKLQKARGRDESPSKPKKGILRDTSDSPEPSTLAQGPSKETPATAMATKTPSTMRVVSPEREEASKPTITERVVSPEVRSRSNSALSKVNPINMLNRQQDGEPRPEKVKKAKQRIQLDDFDSEEEEKADPFADPKEAQKAAAAGTGAADSEPAGRLSESPVQITVADAQPPAGGKEPLSVNTQQQDKELEADAQHPPGLTADTSSAETPSPISTPTPDDSPIDTAPSKPNIPASRPTVLTSPSPTLLAPAQANTIPPPSRPAPIPKEMMENTPPTSSESHSLPAWSDASLRSYLDDGSDIRDMLMVINDTTGVVPVGRDHPLMSNLYVEEEKTVERLGVELDGMLMGWMEKKRKKREEMERAQAATQATQSQGWGGR
ncbi:hypothetical protein P154DRAFT_56300 [Amniculicola lignicola CBS 123094]|uniref:SH3 domain-containing protein n=1 Tax=Amniculicola lignicola CBS 123094 TaxID=1392246 RepID=A0A6A5WTB9_9PLEO|nr:hypothetical protein P154DRAFT_56300 [Amniculicola lignicola CBS 123094]